MTTSLPHILGDDQRLLAERAVRASHRRDEVVLEEGSRRQAIFTLRSGHVRVERAHLGRGVALARLGPGDTFGEMSFLESAPASASIIADTDDVELDVIDAAAVHSLLASVPGLAARFYHSLATLLSRRLRETTAMLPALMVEDVPQVNRFHRPRASRLGVDVIPPSLTSAVEAFKVAMLGVDRALAAKKIEEADAQRQVSAACDAVMGALRRHIESDRDLAKGIGAYVFRETFPLFMLSELLDRSFTKPRGYAGDFYTIQIIYEDVARGDGRLGKYVDRWMRSIPATTAVRNRRGLMTGAIREVAAGWTSGGPMPVTSLASGPAREAFDILADPAAPPLHLTCIDIDNEALSFVAEHARASGTADRLTLAQDNLIRLSRGRGKTTLPPQQMMYSIGLIDYLQDALVVDLLSWIHDNLLPGGTTVIGNFDTSNPDKPFMDHILEWELIHRSPDDMRRLFAASKFGSAPVDVRVEGAGVNLFAFATKQ